MRLIFFHRDFDFEPGRTEIANVTLNTYVVILETRLLLALTLP